MGIQGLNREQFRSFRPVFSGKPNRCVISSSMSNVGITAEFLERKGACRFVRANFASDLTLRLGKSIFHLHKLPMVSRSGYLNRLVFQASNKGDTISPLNIQIHSIPGGSKIFELVVKFCYGLSFDLTAANVAPLYCAAHFLEMHEDIEQGNLMLKTEAFLSFIILTTWKDTFRTLKSCEYVSSWAKKLSVVDRCSESIAWKACLDPKAIGMVDEDSFYLKSNKKHQIVVESWWFEDVSVLRIDHFVEVINGFKTKGMKSKLVGSCIAYWTSKWLSKFKLGMDFDQKEIQRLTVETLIRILPKDGNSVSFNFLLHLLRLGLILNGNKVLIAEIEKRLAMNLENCCVGDLVVRNYRSDHGTIYDVGLVIRVVEAYVDYLQSSPMPRMGLVVKLVDQYLQLNARDDNLSVKNFQLLADALPENARLSHDNIYRAIDMYLKAHPRLTAEERKRVCRAMDYRKLSREARNHVMKNDRLPSETIVHFILLEQVDTNVAMLCKDSNDHRSKSESVVRVTGCPGKRWVRRNSELKVMKTEVEKIKVQISEMQVRKLELQRQIKIGLK